MMQIGLLYAPNRRMYESHGTSAAIWDRLSPCLCFAPMPMSHVTGHKTHKYYARPWNFHGHA